MISTVLMWLADLGSSSDGGSNQSRKKCWNIFFIPFTLLRFLRLILIIAGNFPPSDIGPARIGQTQGLDYKKPILYVIPIQSILGKLPLVSVGNTGTIPHSMRNAFSGAPGDRRPGAGDGCRMWFVNSWALGWSRDL
jgi:hypothetical protein